MKEYTMTRKMVTVTLIVLLMALAGACSMGGAAETGELTEVRFSSGTEVVAQNRAASAARAAGNTWENGDGIGIYMINHSESTPTVVDSAENIKYKTDSAGANPTLSPAAGSPTIYYPVNIPTVVDFIAYYPHQSLSGWTYPVNVGTQTSQPGIDLMWSGRANNSGPGYAKRHGTAVTLGFTHQLVKLELTVQNGDGVANLSGLAVSIKGMNRKADFNVSTGEGLNSQTDPAPITPKDMGSYKYEAILLPVAALESGHTIEFAVGGNNYIWNLSGSGGIAGGKLEAGKKYAYTVTVKKHALVAIGTINNWTAGSGGTGVVE